MCFCLACEWMNEWTNGHHCWWECQGFLTSTQTGRASPRLGSRRVGHDVPEVTFLKLCALYLDFHQKKKKKWVIVFPKSCDWNIMWWLTLSNLCCTVKYGNNVWASWSDLSGPPQQLQIYWSESFCEDVYALGGMNVWWAGQDSVQCIVVLCSFLVDWMFLQSIFFGDHLMPQGRGCERTGRSCSQLRLLLAVAGSHAFSGREAVLGKFTRLMTSRLMSGRMSADVKS